jgi:2-polyprenyl-6-hydroxyphenyl methylase/3-demethylubiquinone-9 3-methyltransferase
MTDTTIDPAEAEKFASMAEDWWDPAGKFRPLHKLNPVRIGYVRDHAILHFGKDGGALRPLGGLSVLDIGCGGGLLSEPLARLGAAVTGLDVVPRNIAIAQLHATQSELAIDYRESTAEALAAAGETFDIVLSMEVIEHVDNVPLYVKSCAQLTRPGGLCFTATINRTLRAYAFAVFAAENILRWMPRGSHDWEKFLTPDEVAALFRRNGLKAMDKTGVVYPPLADEWRPSLDLGINYMLLAERPAVAPQ